ncbi:hypothetical protein GPECTOR_95g673 [Gonium pectorale]|uniref:Uncharacterized protein n=1 Tax=Gonium pectorale TaxID=33097 RepID=A0A150G0B3_GONPE|nr:hypothetical protein GPECTOR_95g673 [Gonium pectorale]|eukprot:KXZ43284.1 hypothetical protein GPECTOR_95g673 [Gonium pectorale]
MVSCPASASRALSPRSAAGNVALRGVTKHSQSTAGVHGNAKAKKVQRALCTIFEENAQHSSPYYAVKSWLQGGGRHRGHHAVHHPALGRLRLQEHRETPTRRKATPIKERPALVRSRFGRCRLQGELDALADELLTSCQLASGPGNGSGAGSGFKSPPQQLRAAALQLQLQAGGPLPEPAGQLSLAAMREE